MPLGRPSEYDPVYCEQVIDLGAQGLSQVEIAVRLGIPRTTLRSWADRHEEFSSALTRAKEAEQAWWENAGRLGLTADKFNAQVWVKSVASRFREDYTDRKEVAAEVTIIKHEDALSELE